MKVFISWSGSRSRAVAEALRDWLPNVIQVVEPRMSSADSEPGARWASDVVPLMQNSQFGLICLTPENLNDPWMLFEAGALSRVSSPATVCPYLFALEPSSLTGPLVAFQAARATREDTRGLVLQMNKSLGEESLSERQILRAFDAWWPDLEERFESIRPPSHPSSARRSQTELLEELLALTREQTRLLIDIQAKSSLAATGSHTSPSSRYDIRERLLLELLASLGDPDALSALTAART
jgi:hypothetical protein